MRTVRSFDPCLPCGVHMYLGEGNEARAAALADAVRRRRVSSDNVRAAPPASSDLRATGERIDTLLDASSAGGTVARERAEELVRLVADLYGAGLERVLEVMHDRGHLDDATLDALAGDDLVAEPAARPRPAPLRREQRVERALDGVRPYLGRTAATSSCSRSPTTASCGCGCSAAATAARPRRSHSSSRSRARSRPRRRRSPRSRSRRRHRTSRRGRRSRWPRCSPASGRLGRARRRSAGSRCRSSSACHRVGRPGDRRRDAGRRVPRRHRSVRLPRPVRALRQAPAGATVTRRLGGGADDAVLTCPACRAHYDVRRAGVCLDDESCTSTRCRCSPTASPSRSPYPSRSRHDSPAVATSGRPARLAAAGRAAAGPRPRRRALRDVRRADRRRPLARRQPRQPQR